MKKMLFLLFHGFDPSNGISKKVSYQLEALRAHGLQAHICYMDETASKRRMIDDQVLVDYGTGWKGKILKRIDYLSIANYVIRNNYQFVYMRSNHNANPFTIEMVKRMKRAGIKVVMEIPTYPYDREYFNASMRRALLPDRIFRRQLARQLDAIVTFSDDDSIFGKQTIKISNGIDFEHVRMKLPSQHPAGELHLIGVAEIHRWHGFDRVIKGMADYYRSQPKMKVFFHLIGFFFSPVEEEEIKGLIKSNHLETYIILHGKQHDEQLDALFDTCDFGIGSLGRHRVGLYKMKTLKNREYAARGIPFAYAETDEDFDGQPYVLKIPADETPLDIRQIINFSQGLRCSATDIRQSIEHLSWKHQMGKVVRTLFKAENGKRIVYCIPSLNHSGGMERVLTTKANYLADKLEYDVHVAITDNANTSPYFALSPKVKVWQLNVNIDGLWEYPVCKRLWLYQVRMVRYKKKLAALLYLIRPDITISLLRREINFLTSINDGSRKVGEIHFGHYRYREAHFSFLPTVANRALSVVWMRQLTGKLKELDRFVVLTHEDAGNWKGLHNIQVISNPLTIQPRKLADVASKNVIAVGRYTYQKGFDMLIEAWKQVNESHPDWTLNIYGGGNRENYQQIVDTCHLSNSIVLNGSVGNIQEKYTESSIFVLSSRFEGLPLALMEAMASGLPAVAFACPCGPKEIITHQQDGLLCAPGNIHELAQDICCLIENESLRKTMGEKAVSAIQHYNIDAIMHQWDVLFHHLSSSAL
jgi:glycosyltransferase involved in cell wall biosynthesis